MKLHCTQIKKDGDLEAILAFKGFSG